MARPREYAVDDVLRRAMEVFWRKGFVAASLSDIYEATGLKPGNLYATFRSKEALFRLAFDTYAGFFRATLPTDVDGLAAIEAWLRVQARLATDDPERRGCLIVNTITEREAHPPETRALADARLAEIGTFFAHHLAIAVARGELPERTDQARQADALVGAVVAIMSLARAGVAASVIDNVAAQAIAALRA